MTALPAEEVARRSAEAMWAGDRASQGLGMEGRRRTGPGHAADDGPGGHGQRARDGPRRLTFALADSAFAFACNSYNRSTVAAACEIRFLAPTRLGDVLVAEAAERSREGRDGVYDIIVRTGDAVVAEFVGRSKEVRGYVCSRRTGSGLDKLDHPWLGTHLQRGGAAGSPARPAARDPDPGLRDVPHYRRAFDDAGVSPAIGSLEDLARFPFTAKEDLRQNYPFGMFAVPREQVMRVHASSGTTGRPTVVATPPRTSRPGPR